MSTKPSPRAIASRSASSISFDARASSPWQAASISFGMLIRRLPVASMIESISSTSAAAASSFPSNTCISERCMRAIGKHAESARSAGDQHVSGGQQMPGLVVEHVRRDATREPWPAHVLLVVPVPVEQCGQCELEDRSACAAAVREPDGETIEEHVRGTLRPRGRRRGARRGGRVPHAHAEPAGDGRRVQGFQVRFARESRIERFEPLGRIKEDRRAPRRCD